MWCLITLRRWAKRLLGLALGAACGVLVARAMEQAGGYGSVASILLHPLHLCAHFSKEGPLELLLDTSRQLGDWSPIAVDDTNSFGMTALHTAALAGSDWAAVLLLQAGADPRLRNSQNQTVLMVARSAYERELVRSGPRRIAAYLINDGACELESCEPTDAQAMREYEVLAARTNKGAVSNTDLPGGPRLSLDEREKLYNRLWSRAMGQHEAKGGGDGRCETCSWVADLQAMVWQIRRHQAKNPEESKACKAAAAEWVQRSSAHNPTFPTMAARQRMLLDAADAGTELTLASGTHAERRVRLERQHQTEPILLVRGLLTSDECDKLAQKAEALFNVSLVGGMGDSTVSKNIRNSETAWIHSQEQYRQDSELPCHAVSHASINLGCLMAVT
jgi:hypothetical protein